jgi:hypothetical protein
LHPEAYSVFQEMPASSYWRDFYDIKHTLTEVVESTCEGFFVSRYLLCLSGNGKHLPIDVIFMTSNIP